MPEIVDAHQHFWDLGRNPYPWLQDQPLQGFRYGDDYEAIKRNYLPDDYRRDAAKQNVIATVHMEAEWARHDPVAESAWLQEIAERHGLPNAVVGWADFARPDIAEVLAGHAQYPLLRSIRQKPISMADPEWRQGYALLAQHGFHYDLQAPWGQLGEAAALARDFPDTLIILNHTGLPVDRDKAALAAWRAALEEFAAERNTAIKISGLGQSGQPWTVAANRRVVREAIEVFGTGRTMFASNWPVDSLAADSLDTVFDGFAEIVADFGEVERRRLFRDNAMEIYRISL
ncbi:MAG: amidohydrolase family protein [Alphaproteobacteria bacterium]|jgi:predicted TIM-barrel fold metal-dependent hydrolase|nr:thioesterase [Rhodospirillaceae bacterium]MDP6406685.1 amidohydrolase family protein [Alphaproteobacteria bacterium]MDP6621724.1 amidohydrolase family protein [Alphaproteobacteria bacterium]|tara:strand:+ start:82 stop:945 length:864 start_codon:yes stop_codon:yes gene_type:complete